MPKKILVVLLITTVIVGTLASLRVFYVRDLAGGTLAWKQETAFIFLNLGTFGYRMTYLQYMGEVVSEMLHGVREPSDKRFSVVVLKITPNQVQQFVVPGDLSFTPSAGGIFSGDENGKLWKWDDDHITEATAEERQKFFGKTFPHGPDYDDVDGWHFRCCFFTRQDGYRYVVDLKGATVSLIAREKGVEALSIDWVRPDGSVETIWHLDENPRRVSKSEYQRDFAGR